MLRLLDIVLSVAVVAAQPNPTWYGFRPTASSPTSSVDLVDLDDGAKVRTTIGSVSKLVHDDLQPDFHNHFFCCFMGGPI